MEREVLLLLPLPAGVDSDSALVRRLFERWWQGAAAVAPGGASCDTGAADAPGLLRPA